MADKDQLALIKKLNEFRELSRQRQQQQELALDLPEAHGASPNNQVIVTDRPGHRVMGHLVNDRHPVRDFSLTSSTLTRKMT